MNHNIWTEFYQEIVLNTLLSLKKSIREVKYLFNTILISIKNPIYLVTEKNSKENYLSAAKSSKTMLKLVFLFITIHVFFDFNPVTASSTFDFTSLPWFTVSSSTTSL